MEHSQMSSVPQLTRATCIYVCVYMSCLMLSVGGWLRVINAVLIALWLKHLRRLKMKIRFRIYNAAVKWRHLRSSEQAIFNVKNMVINTWLNCLQSIWKSQLVNEFHFSSFYFSDSVREVLAINASGLIFRKLNSFI